MELPSKEILVKLYRDLLTSRRVEAELWSRQGNLAGSGGGAHRGPGEEVIPIAFCNNLTETDCFMPNFRTGVCRFTKPGYNLLDIVAGSMGKVGRKDVWAEAAHGMLGGSGTLGEASVRYVGGAAASVMRKTGDVVVFTQGDGASNRAPTHEAMAVAAAWHLPIIFCIQNNKYGMGTSVKTSYNIEDLSVRGLGYGFPSERVDGNDMIAMYLVAKRHIDNCRAGGGPSLIAADTFRLRPHFEGDGQMYRPKGEVEDWWKFEPLARYAKQLMDLGTLVEADIERIEAEVQEEIKQTFAEMEKLPNQPDPADSMDKMAIAEL
jgi:TPP-dependent pyruvate/acetoin dehydrogenase alpha subunit